MQKILLSLVLFAALLVSCSSIQELLSGEAGNVKNLASDDAEMNVAIQKAQETLPQFIAAFRSPKPTQNGFSIKVRFPYGEADSAEHMWVNDLTLSDDQFEGVLGNEPVYVKKLHLGDQVVVDMKDISDWIIVDGNSLLGGFTIHVLRNKMTESERKRFDAEFGLTIPDSPALP